MAVADVVRVKGPLGCRLRLDHEYGFRSLHNRHYRACFLEHEAITGAQNAAPRQGEAELEAAVGFSAAVRLHALFPAQCDHISQVPAGRLGQLMFPKCFVYNSHHEANIVFRVFVFSWLRFVERILEQEVALCHREYICRFAFQKLSVRTNLVRFRIDLYLRQRVVGDEVLFA
jgi:hypothetical protein